MSKKHITVTSATGAAAINTTTAIGHNFRLDSVTVHFSAAPSTAGNLTVKVDAKDGTEYDTVIYTVDPSSTSATDIVFIPDEQLSFESGDEILVEYANANSRTYGLRICTQSL